MQINRGILLDSYRFLKGSKSRLKIFLLDRPISIRLIRDETKSPTVSPKAKTITLMNVKLLTINIAAFTLVASVTALAGEDAVMHWNAVLENAIITAKESPGTQGRIAAIVQSAVY